MTMAVCFS